MFVWFSIPSRAAMKRKELSGKTLKRVEKFQSELWTILLSPHSVASAIESENIFWNQLILSLFSVNLPTPLLLILKFIHHQHFIFISLLPPPRVLSTISKNYLNEHFCRRSCHAAMAACKSRKKQKAFNASICLKISSHLNILKF